jgi:hypothetical protein
VRPIEKQLRIAGSLVLIGLLIELISLLNQRPTPFAFFFFAGGALLMLLGLMFYLVAIVFPSEE